jgi:hypothetical protein
MLFDIIQYYLNDITGHLISHQPANAMESTVIEHPHTNPNCEGAEVR